MHVIISHRNPCTLLAMTALVAVVACGKDSDEPFLLSGGGSSPSSPPTLEPDEKGVAARLEVPALKSGNTFVYHTTTEGGRKVMSYCLEFDPAKMHSRWVAFRFDGLTRPRSNVGRTEAWSDDPALPLSMHIGTNYFGSPYNRGHLCASYDRQYSFAANAQTFYMSNMSPQVGDFNAYYWTTLEQLVQDCGRSASFADTLYVVKGGYIDDTSDLKRSTAYPDGYLSRPNGKRMAIPSHYFMALLRVKGGSYTSIAFWTTNDSHGYSNGNYAPRSVVRQDAISVRQLEELTGIDFFHNLPDNIEKSVEATFDFNTWNI